MPIIRTVLGDIPPEQLGFCQCHEHLSIEKGQSFKIHPALCIDSEQNSMLELTDYYTAGGRAVADAQPVGCGRNAKVLQTIAKQSGVHIIASTGFHKMIFYPENHWVFSYSQQELQQIFTAEITQGMYTTYNETPPAQQTGAKAGFVKSALDAGEFTLQYQKMFAAAAGAALQTGAPLMVHIEGGSNPVALADFLQAQGVAPHQLIFCHMDRMVADLSIHQQLCRRGIFLEYDTVARFKYHSDEKEIEIVQQMLAAGFGGQLLMSLDVTRQRLLRYGGEVGLPYILTTFIPKMLEHSISQTQIQDIFGTNPAKAFAF